MASEDTDSTHPKTGLLSLRQSSQPTDMAPKPLLPLQNIEGKPLPTIPEKLHHEHPQCSIFKQEKFIGRWRKAPFYWALDALRSSELSGLPLFEPIQEIHYENTYKTQPDKGCKFNSSRTQQILESVLASYFSDVKYNPANSGQLVQNLSDLIRSRVKDLTPPRYKLVCNVFLGQLGNQGLHIASRSLWDVENDSFASATFTNSSLFAVVTVHGLYYE